MKLLLVQCNAHIVQRICQIVLLPLFHLSFIFQNLQLSDNRTLSSSTKHLSFLWRICQYPYSLETVLGLPRIHRCLNIFQWKVLVIPHTLFISIPILDVFSFLNDKATLSSSAVSLPIQVKYSLSMLPSKLAFLFLEAILHLVKEMLCA